MAYKHVQLYKNVSYNARGQRFGLFRSLPHTPNLDQYLAELVTQLLLIE